MMKERLHEIREKALAQINSTDSLEKLNEVRVSFLGKKGELTEVLKGMKDVAPQDRPAVGQIVNETRQAIEEVLENAKKELSAKMREVQLKSEVIDVTLPAKKNNVGHRHPNTVALDEVKRIFVGMGYEVVEGPEVEYDYYNFEALNIPANHPAKDEQDTFYINDKVVLRTQTSPVQVREMEKGKLPIRMIAPGRVFRADEVDATHSPCFTICTLSGSGSRGMVSESRLRAAVTNLYTTRLKLGMEQDKELPDNPYDKIPYSVVDSVEMREFNESVSEKTFVLLKNNGILPLNREKLRTIAVIGPNADSRRALVGNYEGTASRYITISEGIQDYVGDSVRVLVSEGCDLYKENWKKNRIAEVREMAEMSDVVILCLGLDAGIEGEQGDAGNDFASGDKPDLKLPGEQNQILEAALDSGKPVVVLLLSGSALAVNTAQERAAAVMQCWYPVLRADVRRQGFYLGKSAHRDICRLHFIKARKNCRNLRIIP